MLSQSVVLYQIMRDSETKRLTATHPNQVLPSIKSMGAQELSIEGIDAHPDTLAWVNSIDTPEFTEKSGRMRLSRLLSMSAIAGAGLYCVSEVVLHIFRTDYNPVVRFLSEYAVGRLGILGTVGFWLLAGMTAAVTMALALEVRRSGWLIATCFLLSIASLGFCGLAVFPTDLMGPHGGPPPIRTATGVVHDACTSVLSAALALAALALPSAYKHDPRLCAASSKIRTVGVFIPFFLTIAGLLPCQWRGAGQRLAVASGLVWIVMNGRLLLRSTQSGAGQSDKTRRRNPRAIGCRQS